MQKFTPFTQPREVEFFTVFTQNGERYIHLHGYTYKSDVYWANMEACGVVIPLAEFIQNYQENGMDYVDGLYEQCKQYQGDYDDNGILDVINHYYRDIVFSVDYPAENEGNPDAVLDYGEVTLDTPDGGYIILD
jgi:hypothetical protein